MPEHLRTEARHLSSTNSASGGGGGGSGASKTRAEKHGSSVAAADEQRRRQQHYHQAHHRASYFHASGSARVPAMQSLGRMRDWTGTFLQYRKQAKEASFNEREWKVIVMQKLLFSGPRGRAATSAERIEFERNVARWQPNSAHSVCPVCHVSTFRLLFGSSRHHCRLCGTLMCEKCSQYLSNASAGGLFSLIFFIFFFFFFCSGTLKDRSSSLRGEHLSAIVPSGCGYPPKSSEN
jgi:hypothetical protein